MASTGSRGDGCIPGPVRPVDPFRTDTTTGLHLEPVFVAHVHNMLRRIHSRLSSTEHIQVGFRPGFRSNNSPRQHGFALLPANRHHNGFPPGQEPARRVTVAQLAPKLADQSRPLRLPRHQRRSQPLRLRSHQRNPRTSPLRRRGFVPGPGKTGQNWRPNPDSWAC